MEDDVIHEIHSHSFMFIADFVFQALIASMATSKFDK